MSRSLTLRSRGRAAVAVGAALALAATPLVALATETPEETPEAVSEEGTAETTTTEAPTEPLPTPKTNEYSLGQSLQIRVGPDGLPNSTLADFRWSVNQLTVQGEEEGEAEVPVPDRGHSIRSLLDFSNPPQEDGIATLTADVANGYGLARTVSLYPEEEDPPIELEAAFTLDGQPIDPWDLVGKDGVVTATYTLTNTSTAEYDVEVTDLSGNPVTKTVEGDQPMVAIAKTLLPQRYTGLNTGSGVQGADGRGNNQVQFIALPFRPLSEDGTSTFGWAANVEDAEIPSMLIQVAPVYIPEGEEGEAPAEEGGGGGLGLSAPNLDPAVAQIQAGVAELAAGLDTLANSGDGGDPIQDVEDRLNSFFSEFGANLQNTAASVDPDNPDGAVAGINEALAVVEEAIPAIEQIASYAPDVKRLADALTDPENRTDLENLSRFAASPLCRALETSGDLPVGTCADVQTVADQLLAADPNNISALSGFLQGATAVLLPTLNALNGVLVGLRDQLVALSADLDVIGAGLAERNISLPTLDQVIDDIVNQVLNSPGGQQVTGGLAQVSSGVGDAKAILGNYIAEVVVTLQGVGQEVSSTLANTNEAVVNVKAELKGLVTAAHQSPLPYGGDPADAPEGTVLAGAYEFRVDAADTNQPSTGPRILVGLLALLLAGGLSYFVGRRKGEEQAAGDAGTDESVPVGAAVGGAAGAAVGAAATPSDSDAVTTAIPPVEEPSEAAATEEAPAEEAAAEDAADEGSAGTESDEPADETDPGADENPDERPGPPTG